MKADSTQLDLYRHGDRGMADAYPTAAEVARMNPFESPADAERRARFYEQQAVAHEDRTHGGKA